MAAQDLTSLPQRLNPNAKAGADMLDRGCLIHMIGQSLLKQLERSLPELRRILTVHG